MGSWPRSFGEVNCLSPWRNADKNAYRGDWSICLIVGSFVHSFIQQMFIACCVPDAVLGKRVVIRYDYCPLEMKGKL